MQELGAPSKKLAEETGATDKPDRALDESLDDVKYDAVDFLKLLCLIVPILFVPFCSVLDSLIVKFLLFAFVLQCPVL